MAGPTGSATQGSAVSDVRQVFAVPAFRRLWVALSLASLGDWLGLLALTTLAPHLVGGGYAAANLAIAGVFLLRLAPAMILGPLAGVVADRMDRRWTMVVANLVRAGLLASIPVVGSFGWLLVATFLMEAASMFFIPAKEATIPNLVDRDRLEAANSLNLLGTYGTAPVAAVLFAALSLLSGALDVVVIPFEANPVALALWVNAATFLVSGVLIARIRDLPRGGHSGPDAPSLGRTVLEGWAFIGRTPLVRGLVVGMLGAFAAGGAVIGLARTFVRDLGAGDPAYGLLFGVVFVGLAAGMGVGPRFFPGLSRRRLFGLSITLAGLSLALLALIPDIAVAVFLTLMLGMWAGIAWVTGYTLLGLEVSDELRGRTFAFLQTMVRVVLVAVLAVAPLVAAAIGQHSLRLGELVLSYNGVALTFLLAGLLAALLGLASLRQMDDRPGVPLWRDLAASLRSHGLPHPPQPHRRGGASASGFFLALEGGEGAGKSTQAQQLSALVRAQGYEVVSTREPGATPLGQRLRALLLDPATGEVAARAEALLYAADRAEHVATVIRPALGRGAVVMTDRYLDSSVAYQGAGRHLPGEDVLRISRWAAEGLVPDLTVVLDIPPGVGRSRFAEAADRLEAEPEDFHRRVRDGFLALAAREPDRYLVVDATLPPDEVTAQIWQRLEPMLPGASVADPPPGKPAGKPQQPVPPAQPDRDGRPAPQRAGSRGGATLFRRRDSTRDRSRNSAGSPDSVSSPEVLTLSTGDEGAGVAR